MKANEIMLVLAGLSLIGGIVMIVSGMLSGVLLFLLSVGLGMVALMRTRNAAGYGNDDVGFNGIGGTGRQQSEVEKRK